MRTVTTLGVFPAYRDDPWVDLMTLAPRAAGVLGASWGMRGPSTLDGGPDRERMVWSA